MAITNFQPQYDNSYEEVFLKKPIYAELANMRYESKLAYGTSVERFFYDISNVLVRSTIRGSASTIDTVTDGNELLTINLEKELVFHISDGERTQAGPLNPAEVIGAKVAEKMVVDLDARFLAEVRNALFSFDTGSLTTSAANGTPIVLSTTTVPQMIARMAAFIKSKNNVELTRPVLVIDAIGLSDVAQYALSKNIDMAGQIFSNGFTNKQVGGADIYTTENLTAEGVGTASGTFSNTETVTIGGTVFTMVSAIGATAGNVLIGANAAASLTNLTAAINNPATTSATQIALSAADQVNLIQTLKVSAIATATTVSLVAIGAGRGLTLSETGANFAWGTAWVNAYFGQKGAIDMVVQDISKVDMRKTSDRRGTNIFNSYLAGIKTYSDGAKMFTNVKIAI